MNNIVHDVQLAFRRFSYDMQTNPRTFLLGFALPAIAVGLAMAAGSGAVAGGLEAARKKKKSVTKYNQRDVQDVAMGAGEGAAKGVGL